MIAIEQFGMDPEQNGMMLSYIGVISLFMQGIGISTLTKRAEDKVLMALSTVTLTVAYFVMVRKILLSSVYTVSSCSKMVLAKHVSGKNKLWKKEFLKSYIVL